MKRFKESLKEVSGNSKFYTGATGIKVGEFKNAFDSGKLDPKGYYVAVKGGTGTRIHHASSESDAKSMKGSYKVSKIASAKDMHVYVKRDFK